MGALESSLYHRISATESSAFAGLISHARFTVPLITAEFTIDAAQEDGSSNGTGKVSLVARHFSLSALERACGAGSGPLELATQVID